MSFDLRLRRRHHGRMTMAGAGHTNAGGKVQIAAAVGINQPAAFAVIDTDLAGLLE